jgi:diadenylate cyclase
MDQVQQILSSIRWQDVVDIMLNSYIVFRLYVIFRGTTAFRLLIGIVFLWMVQRIAATMGLIITSWAIQGTIAVAAMIIIFIFSDEIRGVLRSKNISALLWGSPKRQAGTPVESIVESVFEMAESQCGALIVFPGTEDLKDVTHGGIEWDGTVSGEMIKSIFWKDNPVHDGAIIIDNDKVSRVGVILPLTHGKELPSNYGTRHRAAVGLAEARDALVILVSEERGKVAVALGRDIREISDRHTLEQLLREHLGIQVHPKSQQKREGLGHAVAALLSVLFITAVWFGMTRGFINTLITLEVPVEFQNREPQTEIVATSVNRIRLQLSGSSVLINSIRPEQVRVSLDMANAENGYNAFRVSKKNIALPPGITLVKATPSIIEVDVDSPMKKRLPIQVDWVGSLNSDLVLESVSVQPKSIKLAGNSRLLKNMSTVYTEKISLDKIEKSGQMVIKLALDAVPVKPMTGFSDIVTVGYVVKHRIKGRN